MSAFTEHKLKQFAPHIIPTIMEAFTLHNADDILIESGITSALVLQHFMGQTFVESAGYTTMSENLHYSATRLMQVFGRRKFPTLAVAEQYAGNPVKTANYVYGGRMGNNHPGDGWKYRGGGLIDLTGSDNYRVQSKKIGIDIWNHPDLIRDPQTALQIAAQFFKACGAVRAAEDDDVRRVTFLVNGGYNGLTEREAATDRAADFFFEDPVRSGSVHSTLPHGLVGDFENVDQGAATVGYTTLEAPDAPISATISAPKTLTTEQAKQLQKTLKERNYSPGDVDGNINKPATVGAIATLQKQQGIPVTGEIDDATKDAIQDAPDKVVTEDRANENANTLRGKGSETIAAADNINAATHGVSASGLGSLAIGAGGILEAASGQADKVTEITNHVPGLSEKLALYITDNLGLIGLIILGVALLYVASRLYKNNHIVISERVRKARTGEDMSH